MEHARQHGQLPDQTSGLLRLVTLLALAVLIISGLARLTRHYVERNEAARVAGSLRAMLAAGSFDNEPYQDRILIADRKLLGGDTGLPVYRARLGAVPVAAVLTVIARDGYVGPITLWVAIAPGGAILRVHALTHEETTGLGDAIDRGRSNWLDRFSGRSLRNPPALDWATRRDGGSFDQITGATITSRAVVSAVRNAATYFEDHEAEIFSGPADQAPVIDGPEPGQPATVPQASPAGTPAAPASQ